MRAWMIRVIKHYQKIISPFLGSSCRFHPSCSEYMKQTIQQKGIVAGVAAGLWRLVRCQPFSRGGFDPVEPGTSSR